MKKIRINNKGYSLVEFIIVIAIITLLSVASLSTIVYMRTAKAKEAAVSFDSELATLSNKAKNQACVYDDGSGAGVDEVKGAKYAVRIYRDTDGVYYVKRGYINKSGAETYVSSENGSTGKGLSLSAYIDVKYDDGTTLNDIDDTGVLIVYDKSGRCITGNGKYVFYRRNSNRLCDVYVNSNGSHRVN